MGAVQWWDHSRVRLDEYDQSLKICKSMNIFYQPNRQTNPPKEILLRIKNHFSNKNLSKKNTKTKHYTISKKNNKKNTKTTQENILKKIYKNRCKVVTINSKIKFMQ